MRSHTLVYKGSDLVDNAFCPICHGRFVHRKSRNQHMGLPGCLKAAAANGLPVPETAEHVVELKRQFATRLLGRLADSWFRLWPSQRRKFGAEKKTARGRVHVDDAEPGQYARNNIGHGIIRPPSVRVLDHKFPPLRRVEGPRSRSAFSSSQTQASDWTRAQDQPSTASLSAVSSSANAAFQPEHYPEQLEPPSYQAAEFLPVPPTRPYSASGSSPRALVQRQCALERPVFDYSTDLPVDETWTSAVGASGAQGYGSSSLAGALGELDSGSTPSTAPAASMRGPSEPPLVAEEESTSSLSMDETLAMLFDSFISPIPADAEEIQALDLDAAFVEPPALAPLTSKVDVDDGLGLLENFLPRALGSARHVQPMPPPTVGDAWLTGRRFGIVVDAGSSGSRVQIYSWRDPRTLDVRKGSPLAATLPKVEKGTRDGENWMFKVEPGISSFADKPEDIANHLRPLLAHARELIPPSLQHETPLFLLATAGMRLLTPEKQAALLQQTCNFLVHHSDFKIDAPSDTGPCGSSIRIITGEEEGLFGWIAVNYLMDGFQADQTTYGFLDMGGASTQIAFEPQSENVDDEMDLIEVRLRLLGGEEINHKVFVTTWLGYGTNQARERYVGKAITEHEKGRGENGDDVVHDPCLPADLELTEHPVHLGPTNEHAKKTHRLLGTGSFEQCMRKTASLLNNNSPCPDSPCLMNGVHVPTIDFSVSHFIGVSEYWYSSEHVFGLGGPYDFVQYERAASQFCSRTWSDIIGEHERSQHVHVGDGEVEKDGKIVEVGNWSDKVEVSRLQMQCFKAAWIANVLHDGIGMPRIIDYGGNNTTDGEKVAAQAENKGLGRPTFQSVDTVGDIAISWTLGKMVLEASKEVPPLVKTAPPLADPLDEPANSDSPIKPIRPPRIWEIVEDRLEDHLPASLTREELGFSPVMMLLYLLMLVAFFLIAIPLLKRLRAVGLRVLAGRERRSVLLEEGKGQTVNGGWGSSSRWLRRLSSMFMQGSTTPTPTSQRLTNIYLPPHSNNNSPDSPLRSSTLPPPAIGFSSTTSRSPSPGPAFIEVEEVGAEYPLSGVLSRSRNSSSKNLAAMAGSAKPRSRVASGNGPSYY
ncbi:F-box domain-containing protein [Mycena chlorophos]|uniref:F-box domain-containing protein n=1 Tax=Mycena chlorophos TaxID=658473 RepID=A0A8H6TT05_MYCCL|nr:F-box domain-containing protein [Mycena chlorophos]